MPCRRHQSRNPSLSNCVPRSLTRYFGVPLLPTTWPRNCLRQSSLSHVASCIHLSGKTDDLAEAIRDFVERHEHRRLRKHAGRGNVNGMENFLDIFTTLVRLLYVYYLRSLATKSKEAMDRGHVTGYYGKSVQKKENRWLDSFYATQSRRGEIGRAHV